MALTVANLRTRYGANGRERLRPQLMAAQLTNTNFRGDAMRNYTVDVISPDDPTSGDGQIDSTTSEKSRNPQWSTAVTIGDAKATMTMDQGSDYVVDLGIDDMTEASFDMVEEANRRIRRRLAYEVDQNIFAAMVAGVQTANTAANKGSTSDFIPTDGIPSTAAARSFVIDALLEGAAWAYSNNIWRTGLIDHELFCIMPSYLWASLLFYIKNDKPSDSLVEQFVGPATTLTINSDGSAPGAARVQVFVTNTMPVASSGGKAHGQMIFATRSYMTAAYRPVVYAAENPEDSTSGAIGASVGGFLRFGRLALNVEQARLQRIRQEA